MIQKTGEKKQEGEIHEVLSRGKRRFLLITKSSARLCIYKACAKDLSPAEISQLRQDEAKPLFDDFYKWLLKRQSQTPPKGLLGKGIAYTLNQWHRLIGYNGELRKSSIALLK